MKNLEFSSCGLHATPLLLTSTVNTQCWASERMPEITLGPESISIRLDSMGRSRHDFGKRKGGQPACAQLPLANNNEFEAVK